MLRMRRLIPHIWRLRYAPNFMYKIEQIFAFRTRYSFTVISLTIREIR